MFMAKRDTFQTPEMFVDTLNTRASTQHFFKFSQLLYKENLRCCEVARKLKYLITYRIDQNSAGFDFF